ncbi:hypothetical protein GCM10029964_126120 [Kibdelosporangium lantanae]
MGPVWVGVPVLIAALRWALIRWTGVGKGVRIGLVGTEGRQEMNTNRSVLRRSADDRDWYVPAGQDVSGA